MKVAFCQSVEVDAEVNVTTAEITAALIEYQQEVQELRPNAPDSHKYFAVRQLVHVSHQCLEAVTDELLTKLTPKFREAVAKALRTQADRYSIAEGGAS